MKKLSKKQLVKQINELDDNYQVLRNELGMDHADTFYLKGHRDALVTIHNTYFNS